MSNQPIATGGCLCGAVRYGVHGPLRPVVACHCGQCRRTSGHFVAASAAKRVHLRLTDSGGLRWYRSSPEARRGFCGICGGNLFWERDGADFTAIMAGSIDRPTGLSLVAHIFTDEACDYYRIADDLPRHADGEHGVKVPEA